MTKHIGIVACSAEGAALCYRTLCAEAPHLMGAYMHPEVSMHTHAVGQYMAYLQSGDWGGVANLMLSSAQKLADIGADFAICPDNTIHQAFDLVTDCSPIPWLHIAEVVADEAQAKRFKHLAILGTNYLMTGPVYPTVLDKRGIAHQIPNERDRQTIDTIIFNELVNGICLETSRLQFNTVIQSLKNSGCDAAVLGCTEIPMLVDPNDCPLPTLDSTRWLARAALKTALEDS